MQFRKKEQGSLKNQEEYWLNEYSSDIPVLNLPTDHVRPNVQSFAGTSVRFDIGVEATNSLKDLAAAENTTLFMVVSSIYYILLAKLSGQEDIVVGTTIAGRNHSDLQQIIGMFINILLIRNFPTGEKTFTEFLGDVKTRALEAFDNQDFQFEDLASRISLNRDGNRNPLFDVGFGLHELDIPTVEIPGMELKPYRYKNRTSKVDILLVGEVGENLSFRLEYNTTLFTQNTIERFILYFKRIVATVIENPDKKIGEIEIIYADERKDINFRIQEVQENLQVEFEI